MLVLTAPLWLDVPPDLMWLTFWYCVISVATIRTTPTGMLRLHSEYGKATWAEAVQPVIRASGAVLAWWLMPDVTGFILAFAASEIGTALALWVVAVRVQPVSLASISLKNIPARYAGVWRFVVSTNLSSSLAVAGKQVMILLVGTFGGAYLAGGFRIANQLGVALIALAQTISKAILPELVQSRDSAVEMARRMANIAAIAGVTAVVTAILFGRPGLALIAGEQFTGFYWAMIILSIAGAVELVVMVVMGGVRSGCSARPCFDSSCSRRLSSCSSLRRCSASPNALLRPPCPTRRTRRSTRHSARCRSMRQR